LAAGNDTQGRGPDVTTTRYSHVASASELSADIKAIDLASQANGGNGTHYVISLASGASLTESAALYAVNLAGSDTLTIDGNSGVLDGAGAYPSGAHRGE
jgi:hypothetical protein